MPAKALGESIRGAEGILFCALSAEVGIDQDGTTGVVRVASTGSAGVTSSGALGFSPICTTIDVYVLTNNRR